MSEYIHKSHNVSVLLYHYVCPAKYRRVIFDCDVEKILVSTCVEISKRHEINFIEIGADRDHVHFLVQAVPSMSPTQVITTIKSLTGKEIFRLHPKVKRILWGGNLWSAGYFVSTVGVHGNESQIKNYVKAQGKEYNQLHRGQLCLFD